MASNSIINNMEILFSCMLLIKEITSKDTTPIRSEILRPGQDLSTCIYPSDDDPGAFHLGAFLDGNQVAIVSFYKENNPQLSGKDQYRFRGMATLDKYRNKGYAGSLLVYAFEKIKHLDGDQIWCNARMNAIALYKKMGMEVSSEEFDIPGIGPHLLMKIDLS